MLTGFRVRWGMPNYKRPDVTGACVFFTVALEERGSDLLVREVEALRNAVRVTLTSRPFVIDAWVVLPDHIHSIWQLPAGDKDYGTRWGAIKARFSRHCGKVRFNRSLRSASKVSRGEAGIWQRRFWEHHIRDEADYDAHMQYCWENPVKHGLVERPEDWPYSSVHRDGRFSIGGTGGPA